MWYILISAWWGGCALRPTVSQDQLVNVPPEVVEELSVMRVEEERLADQIASAESTLQQARDREGEQRARLDAQNAALRDVQKLKKLAVQRADPDAARDADAQAAERQQTVDRIQVAYDRAVGEREVADADLQVLRAQRGVTRAQMELAQARAVDSPKMERFERAVDDAQGDLDAAKRRQASVESTPLPDAPPDEDAPPPVEEPPLPAPPPPVEEPPPPAPQDTGAEPPI